MIFNNLNHKLKSFFTPITGRFYSLHLKRKCFYEDITIQKNHKLKRSIKWLMNLYYHHDIKIEKLKDLLANSSEIVFPIEITDDVGSSLFITDSKGNEYRLEYSAYNYIYMKDFCIFPAKHKKGKVDYTCNYKILENSTVILSELEVYIKNTKININCDLKGNLISATLKRLKYTLNISFSKQNKETITKLVNNLIYLKNYENDVSIALREIILTFKETVPSNITIECVYTTSNETLSKIVVENQIVKTYWLTKYIDNKRILVKEDVYENLYIFVLKKDI